MIRKLLKPYILPFWWQDILLLFPRVISGYLLATEFGAPKFGMPWSPADNNLGLFEVAFWFPQDVSHYGWPMSQFPVFFAWMGAFSEAVGGLLLIFGLCTRPVSFLILCTMAVAIFCQHGFGEIWNVLPPICFAWVSLYTMVLGGGRFSLDNLIVKKWKA